MEKSSSKTINVNISEKVTIVEVSKATQKFQSDIFLKKNVNGTPHEINLKSFLGLITLQLKNGDTLTIKAIGEDCEEALEEVVKYLS
ncbi:HPr family phosphocarrier protein [Cytobacillus sp. S13-E01]|uniref:HPr family phosphocarrier protein n=1 Tax=Cytobacillus sp. S13-E01 TaxID=3031326 RepID=UPI0023D85F86|nr:HPr family phosphocarrier protein [Cytobacillus sp. S13-E01]MDF0727311.1 HPr family phosphocarrier protein [Cytobacillus sp. S13-E01]